MPRDSTHPTDAGSSRRTNAESTPGSEAESIQSIDSVPIRVGAPCPDCGAAIEDLEFLSLPGVAVEREMYDVCVLDTDDLPTPWNHPTAIAYHEDPDPFE